MTASFSKNLAKFRKRCGMTQSQLAAKLSVTPQAVSKWENGSLPDTEFLPAIASALGVSLDLLFGLRSEREMPDLEQLIVDTIRQTPKEERADRIMCLFHAIMSAFLDYRLSKLRYPEDLELVTYDEVRTDFERMIARLNDDMKFFCFVKIPEEGINSYTAVTDEMLRLFRMLSDRDAVNIIHYLGCGARNHMQTLEVISAKLSIPIEKVTDVMGQLDRFGLVWRVSAEFTEDVPLIYGFTNSSPLILLLVLAKSLTQYIQFHDLFADCWQQGAFRMEGAANSIPVPQIGDWEEDL